MGQIDKVLYTRPSEEFIRRFQALSELKIFIIALFPLFFEENLFHETIITEPSLRNKS